MRKNSFILIVMALLFVPNALIFAQETPAEAKPMELPASPLDPVIEWITGGELQKEAQGLMNKAQKQVEETTSQALGTAQNAAKDKIAQEAQNQVSQTKSGIAGYVQTIVEEIKNIVAGLAENIKTFFSDLFIKSPRT
jgi:exonuclease VII small subunit